jgi:hypothetical protein
VTHLRKLMLDELECRNYTHAKPQGHLKWAPARSTLRAHPFFVVLSGYYLLALLACRRERPAPMTAPAAAFPPTAPIAAPAAAPLALGCLSCCCLLCVCVAGVSKKMILQSQGMNDRTPGCKTKTPAALRRREAPLRARNADLQARLCGFRMRRVRKGCEPKPYSTNAARIVEPRRSISKKRRRSRNCA